MSTHNEHIIVCWYLHTFFKVGVMVSSSSDDESLESEELPDELLLVLLPSEELSLAKSLLRVDIAVATACCFNRRKCVCEYYCGCIVCYTAILQYNHDCYESPIIPPERKGH